MVSFYSPSIGNISIKQLNSDSYHIQQKVDSSLLLRIKEAVKAAFLGLCYALTFFQYRFLYELSVRSWKLCNKMPLEAKINQSFQNNGIPLEGRLKNEKEIATYIFQNKVFNKFLEISKTTKVKINSSSTKFSPEKVDFIETIKRRKIDDLLIDELKITSFFQDKDVALAIVDRFPSLLADIHPDFKKDKDVVLTAVQKNPRAILFADPLLQLDRDIALAAVNDDGDVLAFLDSRFKSDAELVKAAIRNKGLSALLKVHKDLQEDAEICFEVFQKEVYPEQFLPEKVKQNQNFILKVLKSDEEYGFDLLNYQGWSELVLNHMGKDRDFALAALRINGLLLKYIAQRKDKSITYKNLLEDREVILTAVKNHGSALQYVPDLLKYDPEIVLEAVKNFGNAIKYVKDRFGNDKKLFLVAVANSGSALEHADEILKKDRELVVCALENYGRTLQYAHESLKKDKELVALAVTNNGFALLDADPSFRTNKEIILAAVNTHGRVLRFIKHEYQDKEIVLAALRNGGIIKFAAPIFKSDKEITLEAIIHSNDAILEIDPSLLQDRAFMLDVAKHTSYSRLLKVDAKYKEDKELALIAIGQDHQALKFFSDDIRKDRLIALQAVKHYGLALKYVNKEFQKDPEIVSEAVKNDPLAIEYTDMNEIEIDAQTTTVDDQFLLKALTPDTRGLIADYLLYSTSYPMLYSTSYPKFCHIKKSYGPYKETICIEYRDVHRLVHTLEWLLSDHSSFLKRKISEIANLEYQLYDSVHLKINKATILTQVPLSKKEKESPYYKECQKLFKEMQIQKKEDPKFKLLIN